MQKKTTYKSFREKETYVGDKTKFGGLIEIHCKEG